MLSAVPNPAPVPASTTAARRWIGVALAVIAAMTALRCIWAVAMEVRTDEAYYWTWSKEGVLSFLDHPPMIAWFIRAGTALFGDTAFGVRLPGIVAMAAAQLLIADIVRLTTRDLRAVALAVLLPEASLYYGLLMAKVAPDVALVPFLLAMLWALVRVAVSQDGRWWLAAGLFGGLALLSKYTVVLLVPAILAFALVERRRWLTTPWPYLAALIALAVFSPVVIWNAQNDWASFRFQFIRASAEHPLSLRTFGDYIGLQWGQIGVVLLPVVVSALGVSLWRGVTRRDSVALLLALAVTVPFLFFLWRSLTLRIGDTWPMGIWPPAFALVAINAVEIQRDGFSRMAVKATWGWIGAAIVAGIVFNVVVFAYYVVSPWNAIGRTDPIGGESGFAALAARSEADRIAAGADWFATNDYRTYAMLRWHLKDRVPIVEVNQRARFIGFRDPGRDRIVGRRGLFVARDASDEEGVWATSGATLTPYGAPFERVWRGSAITGYTFYTVDGWTPDLDPPPGAVNYRWPNLATAPRQ